ncbi:MAG TPA: hypothetical protein QGF58_00395 [Myxococcota bacterium]|nr:hypothetical protein [Myxococcota bacterium]
MNARNAERLADGLFRVGCRLKTLVPRRVRRNLDQRLFYAIFNLTRVTNDDYGQEPVRTKRTKRDRG